LSNSQKKCVDNLLTHYLSIKQKAKSDHHKIVEFKAPTGSGKTFMIANLIDQIINYKKVYQPQQKIIFMIGTLSSAELPLQFANNLKEYKNYLENNNLEVEYLQSPSATNKNTKDGSYDIKLKDEKVLVFGSSTFGNKKILTEYGKLDAFITAIEYEGYELIYIRDEAHYGSANKRNIIFNDIYDQQKAKKISQKHEVRADALLQRAARFIVHMSATPNNNYPQVVLSDKDLLNDNIALVKRMPFFNHDVKSIATNEIDDFDLLDKACETYKKVHKQYIEDDDLKGINPAMLIQIDDSSNINEAKRTHFQENLTKIKNTLAKHNIEYAQYFSDQKVDANTREVITLKELSRNNSTIQAIIFKIGPATGWNIPRACMLVQLRNVSSNNLSVQTIGRIKRNPIPNKQLPQEHISNHYYIYSNHNENDPEKGVRTYQLKNQYINWAFTSGEINKQAHLKAKDEQMLMKDVVNLLNEQYDNIVNYFDILINKYQTDNYLIGHSTDLKTDDGITKKLLESKIENSLHLELFKDYFLQQNKGWFSINLIACVEQWFIDRLQKQQHTSNVLLFWYIIAKYYKKDIHQLYKKALAAILDTQQQPEYILKHRQILPNLIYAYVRDKHKIVFDLDKYAYKSTIKDEMEYYFDSYTEKAFCEELFKYLQVHEDVHTDVQIWSKNPVFHGINFQYYAKNTLFEIQNSYPDFLIKYDDHEIFMEIKSKDDFDSQKTEGIIEAFEKYIDEMNYDDNIKPLNIKYLTLLVIYLERNDNNHMYLQGASNHLGMSELLFKQKGYHTTINDLFAAIKKNNQTA
ncbi:DEAD/DEAH box helicase family protein, partial [Ureaplasma miroungigenitalium]